MNTDSREWFNKKDLTQPTGFPKSKNGDAMLRKDPLISKTWRSHGLKDDHGGWNK
jgi:hypothetical protein